MTAQIGQQIRRRLLSTDRAPERISHTCSDFPHTSVFSSAAERRDIFVMPSLMALQKYTFAPQFSFSDQISLNDKAGKPILSCLLGYASPIFGTLRLTASGSLIFNWRKPGCFIIWIQSYSENSLTHGTPLRSMTFTSLFLFSGFIVFCQACHVPLKVKILALLLL